jgi:hypothetical protein
LNFISGFQFDDKNFQRRQHQKEGKIAVYAVEEEIRLHRWQQHLATVDNFMLCE